MNVEYLIHFARVLSVIFIYILFSILLLLVVVVFVARNYYRKFKRNCNKSLKLAFFHPYCNAGGGGERVLWCAIDALLKNYSSIEIFVYTGDTDASPKEILSKVKLTFNISLHDVNFIYLHKRKFIEASRYPYFTLLGQSIGSVILGIEALKSFVPDVFIDTTGCAFTLPLFSFIAGSKTVSYVHYPTISTDMIRRVSLRHRLYNNNNLIARNPVLTAFKLVYYKIFAFIYGFVGRFSDIIMVNSSWTEEHINSLWKSHMKTYKIYPPCDTTELQKIPLQRNSNNKVKIISVSQFRREKNHPLQLRTFYALRYIVAENIWENLELVLVGSIRNKDDEIWVNDMKDLAKHYSIEKNVTFKINISYSELKKELAEALIGIHTMWNEHFGISVVECMAAGIIMIAHKSGGPLMDIIEEADTSRTGFLATNDTEYAHAIAKILVMSNDTQNKIREAARSSVNRFSTEEFKHNFIRAIKPLLNFLCVIIYSTDIFNLNWGTVL